MLAQMRARQQAAAAAKAAPPVAAPAASAPVPLFLKASDEFTLPVDRAAPIVMIGPGTGVAPFVGFIQHVEAQRAAAGGDGSGPLWLYFGCRARDEDWLYRDEMTAWEASGASSGGERGLAKLRVAFSREKVDEKVYVQHLIREDAPALRALVRERGAHLYVCGDGARMAKDVHAALVDVLASADEAAAAAAAAPAPAPALSGGAAMLAQMRARQQQGSAAATADGAATKAAEARAKAEAELDALKAAGRYQLDLWSLDHGFDDDVGAAAKP
jgi:sulfite reductase alpha subunit-like flavoprotein